MVGLVWTDVLDVCMICNFSKFIGIDNAEECGGT